MGDKVRGYAHRVDIVSDVKRVWRALVDPAILTRWCSPKAQIRGQQGGLFRASVDRMTELEAHIDVFDPTRRLRLIYMATPALPHTDSVIIDDFILEPVRGSEPTAPGDSSSSRSDGDGTIIRLLGSGYPATPEWDVPYMRLRTGWQQALARLKVLVEKQLDRSTS
jgi:uncharacterized protein YndB with AHSA1/START domain